MVIKELSKAECAAVLSRAGIGRLGCSLDDQPYVVPINVAYDEGFLYSFATFGQKVEWMRSNPKVCLQVDEISSASQWTSVIALGNYQELKEPQFERELARARKLLDRQHHWWINALAARQAKSEDALIAPIFYRIRIESLTGLRTASEGE
jgi:nitroimidazol reductase NimA-like FMN-containing flavoprotein (pyridoxamine 5'-phosphate oxidase superfamily)